MHDMQSFPLMEKHKQLLNSDSTWLNKRPSAVMRRDIWWIGETAQIDTISTVQQTVGLHVWTKKKNLNFIDR